MTFQPAFTRRIALLAIAATHLSHAALAETIDLYGVTEATLGWEPASGPVAGYYVIVAKNGETPSVQTVSVDPHATIGAAYGDEVAISVSAFDSTGYAGPVSPPSPTLRFNPGQSPPPPDDEEPPPDEPPPPDPTDPRGTALDFDGDGASDLLLRDSAGAIALWRMDGSIVKSTQTLPEPPPDSEIVGNGDYDGNGTADVLFELGPGHLVLWLMHDGVPTASTLLDLGNRAVDAEWHVGGTGDFDGDGHDDVLLFSRILSASQILYVRDGLPASLGDLPGPAGAWSVSATADLDADSRAEVLWHDELTHELVLWDLDAAGPETPIPFASSMQGWRVVGHGDFDGDGADDLYLEQPAEGRSQVWLVEAGSVRAVLELPEATLGSLAAGVGDYDVDGLADLVRFDPARGAIDLWFSNAVDVVVEPVADGAPGTVVSGQERSDDSLFRERLCDADFDGNGIVGVADFGLMAHCTGRQPTGACAPTDLDSDGLVSESDLGLLQQLFGKPPCSEPFM